MPDFLCYHNTERMGFRIGAGEAVPDPAEGFWVVSAKQLPSLIGGTVWVVSGEGKPRSYRLAYRFVVESTEADHDGHGRRRITGRAGTIFDPAIPLDDLPWVADLRRRGGFSLGLRPLTDEFLTLLRDLARAWEAGARVVPGDSGGTGVQGELFLD